MDARALLGVPFAPFLELLAHDSAEHPVRRRALDAGLVRRITALTAGIDVDPDERLARLAR